KKQRGLYFGSAPRRFLDPSLSPPTSYLFLVLCARTCLSIMSSGSFFWVDDHGIESINYQTRNVWFPAFVNDSQASGGTITAGVAGARASFNFICDHALFALLR
ncbi:hypothetical protein LXA43DRAFT_988751, partial [Ganoderma leucocontextum]